MTERERRALALLERLQKQVPDKMSDFLRPGTEAHKRALERERGEEWPLEWERERTDHGRLRCEVCLKEMSHSMPADVNCCDPHCLVEAYKLRQISWERWHSEEPYFARLVNQWVHRCGEKLTYTLSRQQSWELSRVAGNMLDKIKRS